MYIFCCLVDVLTLTNQKFCNFECDLPQVAAVREKSFAVEQLPLIDNFFLRSSLFEVSFFPFFFVYR